MQLACLSLAYGSKVQLLCGCVYDSKASELSRLMNLLLLSRPSNPSSLTAQI